MIDKKEPIENRNDIFAKIFMETNREKKLYCLPPFKSQAFLSNSLSLLYIFYYNNNILFFFKLKLKTS